MHREGSKLDTYREKKSALIDEHNFSAIMMSENMREIENNGWYSILKNYCASLRNDPKIQAIFCY